MLRKSWKKKNPLIQNTTTICVPVGSYCNAITKRTKRQKRLKRFHITLLHCFKLALSLPCLILIRFFFLIGCKNSSNCNSVVATCSAMTVTSMLFFSNQQFIFLSKKPRRGTWTGWFSSINDMLNMTPGACFPFFCFFFLLSFEVATQWLDEICCCTDIFQELVTSSSWLIFESSKRNRIG